MSLFRDGHPTRPFTDLKTALENPRLSPGDTVYLRAGVHTISEDTTIAASDITIRPCPGEVAAIRLVGHTDRAQKHIWFRIDGDNVRFRNLEVYGEPTQRTAEGKDIEYPDTARIDMNGVATPDGLFAACTLHDFITVTWFGDHPGEATQVIYKDCLIYNMGFMRTDGIGDGEEVYSQNAITSAPKAAVNTIFGPCFSVHTQLFGVDGTVHHWYFDQAIFLSSIDLGSRWYIYPGTPMSDIRLTDCITFGSGLWLGNAFGDNTNADFNMTRCYLVKSDRRSQRIARWTTRTFKNNTLINLSHGGEYELLRYEGLGLEGVSDWEGNSYYDGSPTAPAFRDQNNAVYTFAEWQAATGFDAISTLTVGLPTVNQAWVFPCTTAPRVAHLALANWEGLDSDIINVSSLNLTPGATYRLRSAYHPASDQVTFLYDGTGSITIPITGRTVAVPVAWETALMEIDPRFGVWVLETV